MAQRRASPQEGHVFDFRRGPDLVLKWASPRASCGGCESVCMCSLWFETHVCFICRKKKTTCYITVKQARLLSYSQDMGERWGLAPGDMAEHCSWMPLEEGQQDGKRQEICLWWTLLHVCVAAPLKGVCVQRPGNLACFFSF